MKETLIYLDEKLKNNDKIVLGLSGGPDSMCLFYLLLHLKEKYHLEIICAHINHNVRKESAEEAEFVKKVVEKNHCIFEYYKIDKYQSTNFENYARQKRYEFYKKIINKYQANYLMTAHHGDDLIETICMRLTRGSNVKGYGGFKKETIENNYQLLRPLIYTTKEEIIKYNQENDIEYRIDKTNMDETYTRNRFRKNLLPILKKENQNIHKKFLKFSEEMYRIEEFLDNITKNTLTIVYNNDKVNLQEFNKLDYLLKKRIIEDILQKEYQDNIAYITQKHLEKILDVCISTKANLELDLPLGKKVIKSYNTLYFNKTKNKKKSNLLLQNSIKLSETESIIKLTNCDIKKSNYILRLNSKEIALPLRIRNRKEKDQMEVKNLGGKKKIKDIFIDEKISYQKRDEWPIVVDSKDTILWIPGVKKSKFDKNIDEFYDIIYKYVISEEK